jgi:hypothetical protein
MVAACRPDRGFIPPVESTNHSFTPSERASGVSDQSVLATSPCARRSITTEVCNAKALNGFHSGGDDDEAVSLHGGREPGNWATCQVMCLEHTKQTRYCNAAQLLDRAGRHCFFSTVNNVPAPVA